MKVQAVKFPNTPDETLAKVKELRPLIDKLLAEGEGGNPSALPDEMVVIMWHSAMLDFIELINDEGQRVGLLMLSLFHNEFKGKRVVSVLGGYVEPLYRKEGWFTKMFSLAKTVYQARGVDYIEMTVRDDQVPVKFGEKVATVYRTEL